MNDSPHSQVNSSDVSRVDVLIVGTGISGLLAATATLRQRPGTSVLLVEQGLPLAARRTQSASRLQGYGGAGLYLGGRLYLGPTTIPVLPPVAPPPSMTPLLGGEEYAARAAATNALFTSLGIVAPIRPAPDGALAASVAHAAEVGLEYLTSYPSRQPTLDERFAVLAGLESALQAGGARFAFSTVAGGVRRERDLFRVELMASGAADDASAVGALPGVVMARVLVLAPGRYGAQWLVRTAGELGAQVVALPPAFGVRLEVSAAAYDPLTSLYPDPRLQRTFDSDAVLKTYATCPGGAVVPVERYGRTVASGVPRFGAQRGPNTTFAVLLQPGVAGAIGEWRGGERIAAELNARAGNALLVQRLGDLRAAQPTSPAALAANRITPSCPTAQSGDFHSAFPSAYWAALDAFLRQLEQLAPGVDAADTLLYAPSEERFWHFPTDAQLQTRVRGLFVAGDATGQSQGVIQAGVAGTLAGEGVTAYLGA